MTNPVNIIIADDCDAYRKALGYIIEAAGHRVVATASNGLQLLEQVKQYQPGIAFIDIRMPVMDGIAACLQLQQLYPHIGRIALTMYDYRHHDVQEMLQAGANGFLNKDADLAEIARCISTVSNGGTHYGSSLQPVVNAIMQGQGKTHNLAAHEVELLQLIAQELSSEEIAAKMCRSIHTIGTWRQELLVKCGAKNVAGLMKFAVKWGIIKV